MSLTPKSENRASRARYWADWLCKDLRVRNGKWIIGEPANKSIIIFTVSAILAVIMYTGFWQNLFAIIAVAALLYWGIAEIRTGHSRFRKLLGIMSIVSLIILGLIILNV